MLLWMLLWVLRMLDPMILYSNVEQWNVKSICFRKRMQREECSPLVF